MNGLIIDNFAGGGGASTGIEAALGRYIDVAINHDAEAVSMHRANHPKTEHLCQSVWRADPDDVVRAASARRCAELGISFRKLPVSLAWFSPDCKHFSKAKGGKPVEKHIRDLAWVVVRWAKRVRPEVIMLENVEEFQDWGPLILNKDGKTIPDPTRKGETFVLWMHALKKLGYKIDWRELRACDFGAPTIRKRFFMIARCDGRPIIWPEKTHGPGLTSYRTAAECIDWSLPCPSIFERQRPLAENTLRRIAKGIRRYVIEAKEPFIVNITHTGSERVEAASEPLRTITGAHRGEKAIVTPTLVQTGYGEREGQAPRALDINRPLGTVVSSGKHALITPCLAGVGGRAGQSPERSVEKPYHTTTAKADTAIIAPVLVGAGGPARAGKPKRADKPYQTATTRNHTHLVSAFLAQHNTEKNGGVNPGRKADDPLSTITARGTQQGVVAAHMLNLKGSDRRMGSADEPSPTQCAGGQHIAEVQVFLLKYYGNEKDGVDLREPLHTVTAKDRMGLVTIHGEEYQIVDIGMRMLTPRELYRAQGFPDDYIIERGQLENGDWKPMTKTAQVRMCGNSVCPPMAEALVRANITEQKSEAAYA